MGASCLPMCPTDGTSSRDYLEKLNPRQLEAVTHAGGPLLIVAGAGTGKTRVIVYRIAHLIQSHNVKPERLLAVTFTNRAADEMRHRVLALTDSSSSSINVGTFHWLGHRLLRRYGSRTTVGTDFLLMPPNQSLAVIADLMPKRRREANSDVHGPTAVEVREAVSAYRNANVVKSVSGMDIQSTAQQYVAEMRRRKALDLDDLILESVNLLATHADVRERLQAFFEHLLADEYQDTSPPQAQFLRLLSRPEGNITVVGDDDQAIYGWRYADLANMREFATTFPSATVVRLEENYRSTQRILRPANELLLQNRERIGKTLFSKTTSGSRPVIFAAGDASEEAQFVASTVESLAAGGLSWENIGILFRINAQSRALEDAFISTGIPYAVLAGRRFYERDEVARVVDSLRVIATPADSASWGRLLRNIGGIGPARAAGILNRIADTGQEIGAALSEESIGLPESLSAPVSQLAGGLAGFGTDKDLGELTRAVADLLDRVLGPVGTTESARETAQVNVNEFVSVASLFVQVQGANLGEFLDRLGLQHDGTQETNGVQLMTLHAAKGLEFDAVFLTGLEEGLLPHVRSIPSNAMVEEERRLLYVGMTRARRWLYLSYARSRLLDGRYVSTEPSRFLDEMPARLFDVKHGIRTQARDRLTHVATGEVVVHPRWGRGQVRAVNGNGRNTMVTILFDGGSAQTVQLRHAPLKRIS